MVKASESLVRVLVDCTKSGENADLLTKYAVRGFPTILFLDATGTVLQEQRHEGVCTKCASRWVFREDPGTSMGPCQKCGGALKAEAINGPMTLASHDTDAVRQKFADVAVKFARPARWQETLAAGLEAARAGSKPLAVFLADGKPASTAYAQSLDDKAFDDLYEKVVFVRLDPKADAVDAKRFGVSSAPTIVIVDGTAEKPEATPLGKITGKKSVADLRKAFDAALKKVTK